MVIFATIRFAHREEFFQSEVGQEVLYLLRPRSVGEPFGDIVVAGVVLDQRLRQLSVV